jgi:beta-galactosidase GanA
MRQHAFKTRPSHITLTRLIPAGLCITKPVSDSTAATPAFLLHGEPYQIIGGQMDPQRIPYQYWRDRSKCARAMGLNTIFSYVFWYQLEPSPGVWKTSQPEKDIAEYFRQAQEEGLNVVLRPGPYICGEHDFGGFPAWLSEVPGLVVRDYNAPYLNASRKYLTKLAADLKHLQVTHGGPILMVQVENEHGSFGEDHQYIAALRDILKSNFDVPLYTNDDGVNWTLEADPSLAPLPKSMEDLPTPSQLANNTSTELGPLLDGEYYTWAPDQWGSDNPHNTTVGDPTDVQQFLSDIELVLGIYSASISFYMVHGGTNFGFQNGALWQNRTTVFTSNYDYGAPIDESGRTTGLYFTLREELLKYVPNGSVPEPPPNLARMDVPGFALEPIVPLFDTLREPRKSAEPVPMEALGQQYGFILYEHVANTSFSGTIQPGDRLRDRVIVYINGVRQGVIDSQYQHPLQVNISLSPRDKLQLFVENLGRVDYY